MGNLSTQGRKFIQQWEGFRDEAYRCPAGVWTIGYGSTYYADNQRVQPGDSISRWDAAVLLDKVLDKFIEGVNVLLGDQIISQREFDAAVSFAYNAGLNNLANSTWWAELLEGKPAPQVKLSLARWNKATINGKKVVLSGLVARREAEGRILTHGAYEGP
jgi:lysozyme